MPQRSGQGCASGTTVTLVVVGVVALLLATVLGYVTMRDTTEAQPASAGPKVETERVVSKRGGFAVAAPIGMAVRRQQGTVRLTSDDSSLVITVGRGLGGSLTHANSRFLADLSKRYQKFELLASERLEVDDRPAFTTSGRATNASKVRIRFVVVTVRAQPRNYTITAFAAFDSDPAEVLPRVNAVVNGFEVR